MRNSSFSMVCTTHSASSSDRSYHRPRRRLAPALGHRGANRLRAQDGNLYAPRAIFDGSHSAKETAACFVTAYVAEPTCDNKPAADAVFTRYPSPRAAIFRRDEAGGVNVRHHMNIPVQQPLIIRGVHVSKARDARVRTKISIGPTSFSARSTKV